MFRKRDASRAGDPACEERRLVEAARQAPRPVKRDGDDEIERLAGWQGGEQSMRERSREVTAIVELEEMEQRADRALEHQGAAGAVERGRAAQTAPADPVGNEGARRKRGGEREGHGGGRQLL